MACNKLKFDWKKGFDEKLHVGNLKLPFNYFECGEYFFDGIFNCVKFQKGISVYYQNLIFNNLNYEFPMNNFYENNVDENQLIKNVLENPDSSITEEISKQRVFEPLWFTSYQEKMKVNKNLVKSYILKKEAIFIILDNENNIIRLLDHPTIPKEIKEKLKEMFSLSDYNPEKISISKNLKFKIKEFDKNKIVESYKSFLKWFFPALQKENYTGFVLNKFVNSFDSKFMFYNPFEYLERDINSDLDWQYFNYSNVPTETKKLLEQMKLYKSLNVNTNSGNLFEHSIWSLLFAEQLLLIKKNFKDEKKINFLMKKIVACSFLINIGKIDPENNLVKKRKKDFVYYEIAENKILGIEYINGIKKIPIFNLETLNFEGFIDISKLLNEFDISLNEINIISSLINEYTEIQKWLTNWKGSENEVDELINELKGNSKDYQLALLVVSLANLLAFESYGTFERKNKNISSIFFPFITNVPKKYKGIKFSKEDLQKFNSFFKFFIEKIFNQKVINKEINDVSKKSSSSSNTQFFSLKNKSEEERKLNEEKIKREEKIQNKKRKLDEKINKKIIIEKEIKLNNPNSYKQLTRRIDESNVLIDMFESLNITNDSLCVSGNNMNFRKYLENIEIIGKGTFGVVYKAKFKSNKNYENYFIIKEALIDYRTENSSKKNYKNKIKDYFDPENIFLEAIRTEILEKKLCPNFTFFYNVTKCDSCVLKRLFDQRINFGRCYVTFMEAASFDFENQILNTLESQLSMLYQLLLGLHYLHSVLSIVHNDLKPVNILIKNITPGGYLKYQVEKNIFFVKNVGFLVYISDFGVSRCLNSNKINFKQKLSTGSRLAEVVYEGSKPKFIPFRSLKTWYDEKNIVNFFSSTRIDLNQTNRFPPFEFFGDLQDVLRLFVGGNHSVQRWIFKKMPKLDQKLEIQIRKNIFPEMTNNVNDVKLILAIEMLKELYSIPKNVDFVLDEFGV
jgi:hypothetical protein